MSLLEPTSGAKRRDLVPGIHGNCCWPVPHRTPVRFVNPTLVTNRCQFITEIQVRSLRNRNSIDTLTVEMTNSAAIDSSVQNLSDTMLGSPLAPRIHDAPTHAAQFRRSSGATCVRLSWNGVVVVPCGSSGRRSDR